MSRKQKKVETQVNITAMVFFITGALLWIVSTIMSAIYPNERILMALPPIGFLILIFGSFIGVFLHPQPVKKKKRITT